MIGILTSLIWTFILLRRYIQKFTSDEIVFYDAKYLTPMLKMKKNNEEIKNLKSKLISQKTKSEKNSVDKILKEKDIVLAKENNIKIRINQAENLSFNLPHKFHLQNNEELTKKNLTLGNEISIDKLKDFKKFQLNTDTILFENNDLNEDNNQIQYQSQSISNANALANLKSSKGIEEKNSLENSFNDSFQIEGKIQEMRLNHSNFNSI